MAALTQKYRRAIWIWSPRELNDPKLSKKLFSFCQKESITHLYYQIIVKEQEYPKVTAEIEGQEFFRDLIREAHAKDLKVYALLSPDQVWGKQGREKVLARVKALQVFNTGSKPQEMVDGVHFSFDLYFSEGARNKDMRTKALEFLQLLRRIKIEAHMRRPHILFSTDMPFWFLTGKRGPLPRMIFSLRLKEAGEHLLDIVDEAVVFPYSTELSGQSGIEEKVLPALEYTGKIGKKMLIGLETMELSQKGASFGGESRSTFKKTETAITDRFSGFSGFGGIGIHDYENYSKLS